MDDLIDALVRLMNTPADFSGPVNVGNPVEMSMLDIARQIVACTRSTSELVFHPLPQDDPTQRCPDITLAREALGWEPRTALEVGLARTVEYFRQQFFLAPMPALA